MSHVMKKRFGQNFLTDKNLLKKIVDVANIENKDVIEIGPGKGALTQFIIPKAKSLTCYEIDHSLELYLTNEFNKYNNFNLIIKDILKTELNLTSEHHLIGNIPYYITSPILFLFLDNKLIKTATLMMQKEVGLRLVAKPKSKEYNALSVLFQYYMYITKELDVKRHMFYPPPKVDSVVLRFERKKDVIKDEFFEEMIKVSFANKRKTIVNNIYTHYKINKDLIHNDLHELNINENARAEELEVITLYKLSKLIKQHV